VEAGWRVHYQRVGTISHKGSFPGVSLGLWQVSTAHWLTIFLVTSFNVQVHITSEGIVRRIERGYLCQKRAGILGVWMEEDAIEAENNTLQALVSPKLSQHDVPAGVLTWTARSNSAATRTSLTPSSSRTNIMERLGTAPLAFFVLGKLKILYCKIQADVGGQPLLR
jgi:hypothetical protein